MRGSAEKKVKTYVCLPGYDKESNVAGLDIKEGIDAKVITKKTKVIGYERHKKFVKPIQDCLKKAHPGYNITVHSGNITSAELDPTSVDFVFLDLTGKITDTVYGWMQNTLVPALAADATLVVTVAFGRQEGGLFKKTRKLMSADDYSVFAHEFLVDKVPLMGVQLLMLKCLLRDHYNESHLKHIYHDVTSRGKHAPVMVFSFEHIRPLEEKEPRIFPELKPKKGRANDKTKSRSVQGAGNSSRK